MRPRRPNAYALCFLLLVLSPALAAAPSAELYERRGEMFEARWNETIRVMRRGEWESLVSRPGDTWTSLTRPPPRECHWICPPDYSMSRVYFYKASIAVTYGKHDAALEAFNAAEKYSGGDEVRLTSGS